MQRVFIIFKLCVTLVFHSQCIFMRLLTIIFVFILFFSCNCKRKEANDTKSIDSLIRVTDSLLNNVQSQFNFTADNFYLLIDDSLKLDSLARNISIPDSLGFYQFLEKSISEFNEINTETKLEIFFAKDQLNSFRNDIVNMNISSKEYLQEINDVRDMISFLKERVDSNIYLIENKYNAVFFTVIDSLQ
jgi:hypothetical protein